MKLIYICTLLLLFFLNGCNPFQKETRFERLSVRHTGIAFNNLITESDTFNVLKFEYIYNGAGVGVGDLNNDGLPDVFFAGNMVSSRLYLNKGNFKFEDITKKSGVTTLSWCTGVAMADVNQDGWLDIFVSVAHPRPSDSASTLLFLNKGTDAQGNITFKESAVKTGLADKSYSTQAAFLDYDLDGDLDLYLLTNSIEVYHRNTAIGQRSDGTGKSVDKLYRNEGTDSAGVPHFKDVSKEAGIQTEGWGLGICVTDINQDGYPDVYVANDFLSNDHFYINNRNGTFTNRIAAMLRHQEFNGMGTDIADINNDGLNDIVVTDMMPDDNLRQKTMFPFVNYDKFQENLAKKYQPEYIRNVLQLNNGNGTFSDIGYLSGIFATDWSWSALFADFDNDGYRDLLITNGYKKDITDLDFVTYNQSSQMFGTQETRTKNMTAETNKLQGVKKPDFLFHNNGNLTFTNEAPAWGLTQPTYANGAAYADFDNDGDLDLVMNNLNDEAFVYRNNTAQEKEKNNFLIIKLSGEKGNLQGAGAKIRLYYNGKIQYAENNPQRGYKSSMEPVVHFGLGKVTRLDSLTLTWQSGKTQTLKNPDINRVLILKESNASGSFPAQKQNPTIFEEVSHQYHLAYKHEESDFVDFKIQANLPHKHSQQGPALAVGDLNGDGLEDVFIGGAAHRKATVFYQQHDATFKATDFLAKEGEDTGVLLFDADGDHDLDVYCVSGSSEFLGNVKYYQDRLYRNSGNGTFMLDANALPRITASGSVVTAADYDKDGDLDLFVGGRVLPGSYPMPPQSYLLQNNGSGTFADIAPAELQKTGMVTAALWTDADNDGWIDLLLTGEGMTLTFFKNQQGKLVQTITASHKKAETGFWNSLVAGDFDNDGDMDYIAGNLGLNSFLKASDAEPVCIYARDFDENGLIDPILCHYLNGKEYPVHPRETMTTQLVSLRRKLTTYSQYGKMTFPEIFPEAMLKNALILRNNFLTSAYLENLGNGTFNTRPLPVEAQLAPVFGMLVTDFDKDGNLDVLTAGNDYSSEVLSGWYDAGTGTVLKGDGKGNFKAIQVTKSGFFVNGDAKAFAALTLSSGQNLLLISQNQDSLKVFESRLLPEKTINLKPEDVFAEISLPGGKKRKQEFYFGYGYLSQSSRTFALPETATEIFITNVQGKRRKVK